MAKASKNSGRQIQGGAQRPVGAGPEVGTQNNFRYTEKLNKPVIFLVNQLDSDKCDFDNLIATMKDIYGSKCVQIQYPIETGSGFNALIDVLLMKKYSWKPEGGAPIIEDIPEDLLIREYPN